MHIIIIGAGPIGASTARHLAEDDHQVTIIGPTEAPDHRKLEGAWSGHYDQGRLGVIDGMYVPTVLGVRSMKRFDDLATRSSITFTSPAPQLMMFREGEAGNGDVSLSSWRNLPGLVANVEEFGGRVEVLDAAALTSRFPQMTLPPDQFGVLQDDCVLINPRLFTQAELTLAERAGASRIVDEVTALDADSTTVATRNGHTIAADRILVAIGAYTNVSGLLNDITPGPIDSGVFGATVVLLEVEEYETVDFPAWMYTDGPHGGGLITAPREYPDGRWYLKCAGGELIEHPLSTADEITAWVRTGGSESEIDYFRDLVARTLPDVRVSAALTKPCLATFNSSGLPYIDHVTDRVVLATEGERGVMMGDEIGRLAAGLLSTGHWIDPIPSHLFAARCTDV